MAAANSIEEQGKLTEELAAAIDSEMCIRDRLLDNLELLEQFGFGCEDFGDGAILVREVPADLDAADTAATLEEFADVYKRQDGLRAGGGAGI